AAGAAALVLVSLTLAAGSSQQLELGGRRSGAGPDSAQVASFLDLLERSDPLLSSEVSDALGNVWWGRHPLGIGDLADRPMAPLARRDSLARRVTDPAALRLAAAHLGDDNACLRR